ncbi:MAG: insulinase family protein [Chitinophagaceae bacterium]|nr:insulinase family protein [Chitinophagaceae bacterium]
MKPIRQYLALLCLAFPSLVLAQAGKIPLDSKIRTGQLPNGLKYYIIQNRKPEHKIELRMVVNAGAILEDKDQLGLAHLMEHMNFNGLAHFPQNEVVHYLQSIGVDFGADLNAYTSFDETVYILPIPSDDKKKVDQGFQIIADWSGAALLENGEIDKERGVVLEESRLGKGADDRMMKKWLPEYLNGSLYADRLPIGDDELLRTFKYDVLKRFYKDWYRPNLQAVMVVGDIEPAEAERLIKEKFIGFKNPANPRPRPENFEIPTRTASKAMVLSDNEAPYTMIQIIGNSKKKVSATTEAEYLDDTRESLFNAMISARMEELKNSANPPFVFAYGGVSRGWARGWENFQLFAICGSEKIKDATEALVREALKVKKFGFTAAELERAKASVMANYEKMYNERDKTESRIKVDELVRHFLTNEPVPGIEWEYNTIRNKLAAISLTEVNQWKDRIDIDKNYFALVTTKTAAGLPTDANLKSFVDEALKTEVVAYQEKALPSTLLEKQPVNGKIVKEEKDAAIGTTTWTLGNGAKVTYKYTNLKNDEVLFSAYRFGGSSVYPGADYQSADYCNNVVDEMGYGRFSNTDLQKFLSGKTVNVNTYVDLNNDIVSGRSSVKDFETAMQLLYLKCTAPRIDETAFSSFKSRQVQMIAQMKSDPQSYYGDTLNKYMYHSNPRNKEIPDPADFDAIRLNNAVGFYNKRFNTANGMNYFIVGSVPENSCKLMVEKYIGGLGNEAVENKSKDVGLNAIEGTNSFTIKAGTEPKSMVNEMSYFYTPYNQKDELELTLLAEVINNRITDIIREKMSAIYGGGAALRLQKFPKEKFMMQSYLPCGPENAEKVKTAFWEIVNDCKKPGNITADELTKATETSIQKYKTGIQTNNFWLATLSKYQQFGLPLDNINNYESRVKSVKPEALTATANKYLNSKNVLHALLMPEATK